ncbi:OmpA family protein [Luteimonas aquatica]|uniref:OmpA family protein n=1 Tax=Luteimonas aquatica TaxID=450364 RepID=UPI001F5AA593|nr:OmpA family protein [Luteimonas aquatica]
MKDISATTRSVVLALAAVGALAACGTRHVSRDIGDDGRAGEVVFPKAEDIVLKDGTFPNLDNLRAIGPGVTKDQLYALLGRPHFREGYAGVREWDYLFHFRQDGGGVTTCQYKVIFDKGYRGQSFHWAPESCAELLKPPAPPVAAGSAPVATPPAAPLSLSADAMFAFGKSEVADLLPQGRAELSALAQRLKSASPARVRVVGHTDRIGAEAANQALSERRAQAVRQFLLEQGIGAAAIEAEGRGEREPVKQCEAQPRGALIACLAPNRRVEIVVEG